MNSTCNQKGASIIAVIAVMLILAVMGAALVSLVTTGSDVSVNQLQSEQALHVAEGGAEYAIRQLIDTPGYTGELGKQLGSGTVDITVSGGGPQIITSTSTIGSATRVVIATVNVTTSSIAVDTASSANGNTNSLSWSHTTAGSNRILIVGVSIRNSGSQTVTGVTYGGTALTFIGAQNNGTNCRVELWRLIAPAVGANNVIVNLSASVRVVGGAVSFTNVDQTSPIDAGPTFATGNSIAPSVDVTTVSDNAWVMDTLAFSNSATDTVGASQTQRWNAQNGGGGGRINGSGSTEGPKTPAGTVPMSWSLDNVRQWAIGAVALKPAPAGVTLSSWQESY